MSKSEPIIDYTYDLLNDIQKSINLLLKKYKKVKTKKDLKKVEEDNETRILDHDLTYDMYRYLQIAQCRRYDQYSCDCPSDNESEESNEEEK